MNENSHEAKGQIPAPSIQGGPASSPQTPASANRLPAEACTPERLAYSLKETAQMLGINYFSVYRLVQRGKLKACRVLSGKLLIPRTELLRILRQP